MIHRLRCCHCRTENNLVKTYKNRNGTIQYYICRVCNALKNKRYFSTSKGKITRRLNNLKTWQKHPEKLKARVAVNNAIRAKKLVKSPVCKACGVGGRIEGHHMDYTKPLDVIWLCNLCHKRRHGKLADPKLIARTKELQLEGSSDE